MHWTDQFRGKGAHRYAGCADHRPDFRPAGVQERCCAGRAFPLRAFGFAVLARPAGVDQADYWALARCAGGWRLELALCRDAIDLESASRARCSASPKAPRRSPIVIRAGQHRVAASTATVWPGALFVAPSPVAVSRGWAAQQLGAMHDGQRNRFRVVAGRAGAARPDAGAIVCSCFTLASTRSPRRRQAARASTTSAPR